MSQGGGQVGIRSERGRPGSCRAIVAERRGARTRGRSACRRPEDSLLPVRRGGSGGRADVGSRREGVSRSDRVRRGCTDWLRAPTCHGRDRVRSSPPPDRHAVLPRDRGGGRSRRASLRDRSWRLPEEGLVRDDRLGCERLRCPAAADGNRAEAIDHLRRRLPRDDDRVGGALGAPDTGSGDRRRERDQGALSRPLPMRLRPL